MLLLAGCYLGQEQMKPCFSLWIDHLKQGWWGFWEEHKGRYNPHLDPAMEGAIEGALEEALEVVLLLRTSSRSPYLQTSNLKPPITTLKLALPWWQSYIYWKKTNLFKSTLICLEQESSLMQHFSPVTDVPWRHPEDGYLFTHFIHFALLQHMLLGLANLFFLPSPVIAMQKVSVFRRASKDWKP